MNEPRVTLVVPTLGQRTAWLDQCLVSIVEQRGVRCRTIVVAPSSARLHIRNSFDAELLRYDGPGLSAAINHAWAWDDTADYVSWLGDDDFLAPDSLLATSSILDRRPESSMVYGRVRVIDADGATLWMTRPSRFAAGYLRLGKNFVSQPGCLLRRSCVMRVGGLDPSLHNAMDQDLFIRLGGVGQRIYLPRELAQYRWHAGSITATKGLRDESEFVRLRHVPPSYRWLYRTWRVVGQHVDHGLDAIARRLPVPSPPSQLVLEPSDAS